VLWNDAPASCVVVEKNDHLNVVLIFSKIINVLPYAGMRTVNE
jgi:hypothetical protein